MSLVTINTSKTNIANISTVLAEMNIKVNDNQSTIMGYESGTRVRGLQNTVIGYSAAREALLTSAYTVYGFQTGYKTNGGDSNTYVGAQAGFANEEGSLNVGYGAHAGAGPINGSGNVYLGSLSGAISAHSTHSNTCVGNATECSGGRSIAIGAGVQNSGSSAVCVGRSITNSGRGALIINTRSVNVTNDATHDITDVNGVLIAARTDSNVLASNSSNDPYGNYGFSAKLMTDRVVLCQDSNLPDRYSALFDRDVASYQSRLESPHLSTALLTIGTGKRPLDGRWSLSVLPSLATSGGHDLIFASSMSNAVVFTDEFTPDILNFTAKHNCCMRASRESREEDRCGMLVVSTGLYRNIDGSEGVTIDEAVPVVSLCDQPMDPRAFGVIAGPLQPCSSPIQFKLGFLRFTHTHIDSDDPRDDDCTDCEASSMSRVSVNSLGEGGIWVCDAGGDIRNGDFITSSPLAGYGMRQASTLQHNYTFAKATCSLSFSGSDSASPVTSTSNSTSWNPCTSSNSTIYSTTARREVTVDGVLYRCAFIGCSYRC